MNPGPEPAPHQDIRRRSGAPDHPATPPLASVRAVGPAAGHGRSAWVAVLAGLIAYAAFFYRDLLFQDRVYVFRDVYTILLAIEHTARRLGETAWPPLWNPLQVLGKPFAAEPLAAIYYPPAWVERLLPMPLGVNASLAFHHVLAASGLFALLRSRGLSVAAAALGGLLFGFGGTMVSFDNMFNALRAAAWMPWAVLAFDAWDRRRTLTALAGLALALAATMLGGVPEFVVFTDVLLLALAYDRHRGKPAALARPVAALAAGNLVALGLSAVQLVPFAEYLSHSSRAGGVSAAAAVEYSLNPAGLLAFLVPRRFADAAGAFHETAALWEGHLTRAPWALTIYLGPVAVIVVAAAARLTRFQRRFWGGIAVAFAALALGRYLPGYQWLIEHVALLRVARYPEKLLLVVHGLLSAGAALGLEACVLRPERFRAVALAGGALAVAALTAGALAAFLGTSLAAAVLAADLFPLALLLALIAAAAAIASRRGAWAPWMAVALVALAAADLYRVNGRLLPTVPWTDAMRLPRTLAAIRRGDDPLRIYSDGIGRQPVAPFPEEFAQEKNLLLMEVANYFLIANLNAPASINLADDERLHALLETAPRERVAPLLGAFNTAYVTSPKALSYPGLVLEQRPRNALEAFVYRVGPLAPRAYVPRELLAAPTAEAAIGHLRDGDDPIGRVAVAVEPLPPELPAPMRGAVRIASYQADRVELDARMETLGLVVLSDAYYPGWRAEVDGRPAPVVRANHFARGVYVTAGRHRVVFRYAPASHRLGAGLTALTALAILIGVAIARSSPPSTSIRA